jgi:hypothetical protein
LLDESAGDAIPLRLSRKFLDSGSVLDRRRIFSWGVSKSCRLGGRKSSSPLKANSSSSSGTCSRCLGRLEDINAGFIVRFECMILWPKPSSPDPRGEDPKSGPLERASRPYTELCKFRTASVGRVAFLGNDDGGDSRPNLEGTDAATAPCLAIYEMPWLSKDAGIGASSAVRCATGDIGFRVSSRGEPYLESGCEV